MITKYSQLYTAGATKQQIDSAAKKLNLLPEELLNRVHAVDPTNEKKFEAWLIKQTGFENIRLPEDGNRVQQVLKDFINLSNKRQLKQRDIQQYKKIHDLEAEIDAIKGTEVTEESSEKLKEYLSLPGVSILGQNNEWLVLKVISPKSASLLASGTKWCTSAEDTAEYYINTNKGLYIVFEKQGTSLNKFAQFTGDFEQFKDLKDYEIYSISDSLYSLVKEIGENYELVKRNTKAVIPYILKKGSWPIDLTLNSFVEKLPEKLYVGGEFIVNKQFKGDLSQIKNLKVKKRCSISCPNVTALPEKMDVEKDCVIFAPIQTPPREFMCGENATFSGGCEKLPSQLFTVGGKISIDRSSITELPDNWVIHEDLIIKDSPLKTIPRGLTVRGTLDLSHNKTIKVLPPDLVVEGTLDLQKSSVEQILMDKLPRGSLDVSGSAIKQLPENLNLMTLDISSTGIREFPKNCKVHYQFLADNTVFETLPTGVVVSGHSLHIAIRQNKNLKKLPDNLWAFEIDLTSCENLTELPSGLKAESLNLFNTPIKKLPEDILIQYVIEGVNPVTGKTYQEEQAEILRRRYPKPGLAKRISKYSAMKYSPEDLPPQKGHGEIKEYAGFKFQSPTSSSNETLFLLDIDKFNEDWAKDKDMYVGENGIGQVKTRYNDFKAWITKHPEYIIRTPEVYISEIKQRPVGFVNGRHRFSVFRDMGLEKIWVSIHKSQLKQFKERYS